LWENAEERDVALNDMRTVGSIRQREVGWFNRRGERLTILLSAETIKLNDTPHILSFAQDITQRKRAEGELLKTLEREKELNQLKSNFVSMVSHEFRTPLAIIQSSAELLREYFQRMQPAERDEQLESITGNTRRMAGMMEEILILSRLDAGKLNFQPTALDFNTFCRRSSIDFFLHQPRATHRIFLCPCRLRARRLLETTNLLSNAVNASGVCVRRYAPEASPGWHAIIGFRSDRCCLLRLSRRQFPSRGPADFARKTLWNPRQVRIAAKVRQGTTAQSVAGFRKPTRQRLGGDATQKITSRLWCPQAEHLSRRHHGGALKSFTADQRDNSSAVGADFSSGPAGAGSRGHTTPTAAGAQGRVRGSRRAAPVGDGPHRKNGALAALRVHRR
jgi:hypothetical protein